MMHTPSILIVDDEPNNFDVIETFLSQQQYQLHYVANGHDAIAYLDSFQPDLILLDVMMPKMDGLEVCQHIKALPKWHVVPIIMVTALNSKSDLAQCLAAGADDFVSKPINALELRARVNSMLRIKRQYDDIQSLCHVQSDTIQILENTIDQLNGNLASTLAHELNTPLNGIIGTLSFLKISIDTMSTDEVKEMLEWVDASAHRLSDLAQKFRTYLEVQLINQDSGVTQQPYAQFSAPIIQTNLTSQAEKIGRRHDLVFNLENAVVALLEEHLFFVLNELTENALKFSAPKTSIKISSKVSDSSLIFSIHDQGRGMTEEQISQVGAFMQFERKNYEQQGTGIGLKTVQKIVELAGGIFTIHSIYQQETTVEISLPLWLP